MTTTILEFDIVPSNIEQPLGIEVWFNNLCVTDVNELKEKQSVTCEVNDDTNEQQQLKIVVKNKTPAHTIVNEQDEIVSDSTLDILNFKLDGIEIDQLVRDLSVYRHDFNGSGNWIDDGFFNTVGCNGSITLEFTTPSYLWLLENM